MSIDKVVINIIRLINIFFIIYIINILVTLYSIYTFFDIYLFHNLQGSKLKLKKHLSQKAKKEDHY